MRRKKINLLLKKEGFSRLELTSAYSVVGAPDGLAEEDMAAGGDLVERESPGSRLCVGEVTGEERGLDLLKRWKQKLRCEVSRG
jgi:hypothetical protein